MKYHKLVRDKIPEIILGEGKIPVLRIASGEEYYNLLKEKLLEEVHEYLQGNNPLELVDVSEVVHALRSYHKISEQDFKKMRKKKLTERGGFEKKIILEEILD